jgi:hypothetical protein
VPMRTASRDPRHRRATKRSCAWPSQASDANPLRHLRIIRDQSSQIHRVINAGVVKIECEAIVLLIRF